MMIKNYNEIFEKAFNQLNTQQKQAVQQTEGPVLVVAGPGTGKTQILAARIANILRQTDTLPENILCLTYTDAGTIAMRNRLLQFMGPDAYRVDVFTFHAFCNTAIQENLDYFGLRGLTAISDLERIQFSHKIIDQFPKGHPLKRYTGEIYYETQKLLNLYDVMKRENWDPSFIRQKAGEYLADLPNREEFIYKRDSKDGKKGQPKQKAIDQENLKMQQLIAAADTFDTYQQMLREQNRYDFADMIIWVIEAFRKAPELLRNYQEKYLYFLVDEFQDTSGSQNTLLEILLSYWESPNVFCVGDDDQSIYRFQGANIENIQHFVNAYQPAKITLSDNYRSTPQILSASNSLIRLNKMRVDPDKNLVAQNKEMVSSNLAPQLRAYHNPSHETVDIAEEIEGLLSQGIAPGEIAILYRNHRQAENLIRYLQTKNIGVHVKRKSNILEEPFIKKLITLLRYIALESKKSHSGEILIYELLHYDFFGIEPLDIAKISVEVYKKNFNEKATSWREELKKSNQKAQPDLFSPVSPALKIQRASALIEGWIKDQANLTIQQLVEKIITESGILVNALTAADKVWHMQLLHTFFNFIKEECARNNKLTLAQLFVVIDLMEQEHVSLSAQQISYSKDGVNFITAHSAKGLEFAYVFMIGCNSNVWEGARNRNQFKLPDTLFEINTDDEAEESRRLFYVAMTRAKKQLVISYAIKDDGDKALEKSRFVAELETESNLTAVDSFVKDEALVHFNLSILKSETKQAPRNLFDNPLVDELLEKYTLSVTHLNNYLRCHTAFYFNNLIRVPAPMSASMTFGSAIHFALERLFKNMNAHESRQFAPVEELVKDFKWYMRKNQEAFTEVEFKRRVEYGEEILPAYYNKYINNWNKITSVERSYRNVVMDGVPLNGKLDKLEFDGNQVNVVDYKTGQFKNAEKKFNRPDMEKAELAEKENKEAKPDDVFGGDYWRQAVFYKILMDYDKTKNWEMKTTEFDFVEPDKSSGEFLKQQVNITNEDILIVRNQIIDSYTKIKNKQFYDGCNKADCHWCNFTKEYYAGGLANLEVAPLSDDE